MDRAFGELEEALFRSGAVMSVESCTEDAKGPSRSPVVARGSGPIMFGAEFRETMQLGLEEAVELGGYYSAYVIDAPGEAEEYIEYLELRIDDLV